MIAWSNQMINDLTLMVGYFTTNEIGGLLEKLANYFIYKHRNKLSQENYIIKFSENVYPITSGEHKLAFVCELANVYGIKSKIVIDKKNFNNVYKWVAFMIKYCIIKLIKLENKMTFTDFFLTTLIKEKIMPNILPNNIIKGKDDPITNITNFSYFLTKKLIYICKDDSNIIYKNTSLILDTQNLDISICNQKEINEICDILNTKRTLFVRILLVLTFQISKIDINNPDWLSKVINFENYNEFVLVISSSLIETLIFLSSLNI